MKVITCSDLADLILDFLGEELEALQRAAFEQHLCGCPDCVVYVETYQITIALTRALPLADGELPPGMEAKFRAALAAEGLA